MSAKKAKSLKRAEQSSKSDFSERFTVEQVVIAISKAMGDYDNQDKEALIYDVLEELNIDCDIQPIYTVVP